MTEVAVHNSLAGRLLLSASLIGLVVGCSSTESTTTNTGPQGRVGENSVLVTVVDRAGFDAALVQLRGQVVLVDCWATWCIPCLEQLPHSLKLAAEHKDRGLAVCTVCFDDPSRSQSASKILNSKGGTVGTHFISQSGGSSKSMDEFEITGGALPHYKLFDRTGKLVRTFALDPSAEKQFTTEDIEAAVEQLLAEN